MKKNFAVLAAATTALLSAPLSHASQSTCKTLTLAEPALLVPTACNDPKMGNFLNNAAFADTTFWPVCYVSAGKIQATLGSDPAGPVMPVTVSTRSAVIAQDQDVFGLPYTLGGSFMTIGTQWRVSDQSGRVSVDFFTYDVINVMSGWEVDKIFASTRSGLVGHMRVHSQVQSDGSILVDEGSGKLCF